MMKITTKHLISTDYSHTFSWKTGLKRRGIVHVTNLGFETDAKAAAEAIALGYLIREKKVFARDIETGKGIEMIISQRRLHDLARTKVQGYTPAFEPTSYLSTNYSAAVINVGAAEATDMPELGEDEIEEETIDGGHKWNFDAIQSPSMGSIRLTRHAVDRYKMYHTDGVLKTPVNSLIQRLQHPELRLQPLNQNVMRHKERSLGAELLAATEMWGMDTSDIHFMVARNDNVGTLVTVFRKAMRYMSA